MCRYNTKEIVAIATIIIATHGDQTQTIVIMVGTIILTITIVQEIIIITMDGEIIQTVIVMVVVGGIQEIIIMEVIGVVIIIYQINSNKDGIRT